MWCKIILSIFLIANGIYQINGGSIIDQLTSGFGETLGSYLGISPWSLMKSAMKVTFAKKHNQSTAEAIQQEFQHLLPEDFQQNVSEACYNAILLSMSAIGGIITGSFPPAIANMLDASGKSASGTMRGTRMRKGNYHQCIDVKINKSLAETRIGLENGFVGKFCQVKAVYGELPESEKQQIDYSEYQIYPTENEQTFEIALCVPSVCSTEDVKWMFEKVAEMYKTDLHVSQVKCRQKNEHSLSVWSIFVIIVCLLLALTLTSATVYHIWLNFQFKRNFRQQSDNSWTCPNEDFHKKGYFGQILLCFSIQKNMAFILNHRQDPSEEIIPSINAIRSLTLFWVIITNIFLISKDRPWVNYIGLLQDLRKWPMQIIINGRFAADTSFCIGLAPAYVLMMMLTTGIYPISVDGPDWIHAREYENTCKQHWWKGLLFVNNFFNGSESGGLPLYWGMCPPISWYLATDMQLHIMAPFLIYPLHRYPGLGLILLSIVHTVSSIPSVIIMASSKLPYFIGRLFYFNVHHNEYTFQILMKPWSHVGPFTIGIFFGYLLFRKGKNAQLRLPVVTFGWLWAITIKLIIIFGFYHYIDGTETMSPVMGILYTTLTPSLWAACTGWIIYACATNNGGIISDILSWGGYDVIARLCYGAYLINGLAIYHFLNSRADSFYYDTCTMMLILTGVTFTTLVSSTILSIVIERPFRELRNLWFGKESFNSISCEAIKREDEDEKQQYSERTLSNKQINVLQNMGGWLKFRNISEVKEALISDNVKDV